MIMQTDSRQGRHCIGASPFWPQRRREPGKCALLTRRAARFMQLCNWPNQRIPLRPAPSPAMAKLTTAPPRIAPRDARKVTPAPHGVAPELLTPEHRAWRAAVLTRAGWRCEALDAATGRRCTKAAPGHRMFADHKAERRDAPGLALAPENGECLCGSHHTLKTAAARAARLAAPPAPEIEQARASPSPSPSPPARPGPVIA